MHKMLQVQVLWVVTLFATTDGSARGLDPRVINISAADLSAYLKPAVDAASLRHNVSFSVGVRTAFSGTF